METPYRVVNPIQSNDYTLSASNMCGGIGVAKSWHTDEKHYSGFANPFLKKISHSFTWSLVYKQSKKDIKIDLIHILQLIGQEVTCIAHAICPWGILLLLCTWCLSITQRPSQCPSFSPPVAFEASTAVCKRPTASQPRSHRCGRPCVRWYWYIGLISTWTMERIQLLEKVKEKAL